LSFVGGFFSCDLLIFSLSNSKPTLFWPLPPQPKEAWWDAFSPDETAGPYDEIFPWETGLSHPPLFFFFSAMLHPPFFLLFGPQARYLRGPTPGCPSWTVSLTYALFEIGFFICFSHRSIWVAFPRFTAPTLRGGYTPIFFPPIVPLVIATVHCTNPPPPPRVGFSSSFASPYGSTHIVVDFFSLVNTPPPRR